MKGRYKCSMVECGYEIVSTKSPLNLLCPIHNILLEKSNKPLYAPLIEAGREICECGHERRDHFRDKGMCCLCDANLGMLCSHFKFPITDYGKFWAALYENYTQIRASGMFGAPRIFVQIVELRSIICKKLKLTKKEFNELLIKAWAIEHIDLHGSPTDAYAKVRHPFEHEGHAYLYLSIRSY